MQTLLKVLLILFLLFIELGFFGVFAFVIGFWWIPQLSTYGSHPLLHANIALLLYCHSYYKWVIQQRRYHSPFHLYFYSTLSVCALLGYLYGIVLKFYS